MYGSSIVPVLKGTESTDLGSLCSLSVYPRPSVALSRRTFWVLLTLLCLIFPGAEWEHYLWYPLTDHLHIDLPHHS